jgi:hypothetical protein
MPLTDERIKELQSSCWDDNAAIPEVLKLAIAEAEAAMRERCAKVCEDHPVPHATYSPEIYVKATRHCALAIRAMKDEECR